MIRVPIPAKWPRLCLMSLVLWLATGLLVGCRDKAVGVADNPLSASAQSRAAHRCVDVIFSLNNQDRAAPHAMTDILMDSAVVFHGVLGQTRSGDYVYVQTHVHRKKVHLEVRSETTEGVLVQEKNVWVGDAAWIVVSRVRDFDAEPELRMVVSYEKPHLEPKISE